MGQNLGIVTGGGGGPDLGAVIRGVAKAASQRGEGRGHPRRLHHRVEIIEL